MSKKITYYIQKGHKGSRKFMHQNARFYFGYALYALISFIGKSIGLIYPVFALSDIKLSDNVVNKSNPSFNNVLDDSNDVKKVWQVLIFGLIKLLLLSLGGAATYFMFIYLTVLGMTMDEMFNYGYYYLKLIFQIVSIALGSIYTLFILLKFAPGVYLIGQHNQVGLSGAFTDSFNIMDNKMIIKVILMHLYYLITIGILGGLATFIIILATQYLHFILAVVVLIAVGLFALSYLPKLTFALKISLFSLYKDASKAYFFEQQLSGKVNLDEEILTNESVLEVLFKAAPNIENDAPKVTPKIPLDPLDEKGADGS